MQPPPGLLVTSMCPSPDPCIAAMQCFREVSQSKGSTDVQLALPTAHRFDPDINTNPPIRMQSPNGRHDSRCTHRL